MPDIPSEWIRYGGLAAAVLGTLWVLSKLLGGKKEDPNYIIQRRCKACGWSGKSSKFNHKCPKCNAQLD